MDKLEKKKRHVSGSRSKSKKSKPNDASVDLKPHKISQALNSQEHSSKVKTQNSVNKSKGSKKYTKYSKKAKLIKSTKNNIDDSKQISRSVSAQRKHSLVKMNRTEANFQGENIERRIYALKKTLNKIQRPSSIKTKQICDFYRQIQDSIEMVSEPLYSLLNCMHELYLGPITDILDMISPYEHLLQKKQQLCREVQEQARQNKQVFSKLTEEEIYIMRLKQTIEQQRHIIQQEKKKQEMNKKIKVENGQIPNGVERNDGGDMFKNEGVARNMRKDKQAFEKNGHSIDKDNQRNKQKQKQIKSTIIFKDSSKSQQAQRSSPESKSMSINQKKQQRETISMKGGGLKLDLGLMNKNQAVGFHDEFYSKIDQFSESWRNQALRQKRY